MPEICCGDFFEVLVELFTVTIAKLLEKLPSGLSDQNRYACVMILERGRTHLLFVFTLKFGAALDAPLVVIGSAHHDPEKAKRACKKALESSSKHPRILELQSGDLAHLAIMWISGANQLQDSETKNIRGNQMGKQKGIGMVGI